MGKGIHGRALAPSLFSVAAALWLFAAFLPSTASGSGATLSGHRFADLMASGVLSVSAPTWLGLLWYAMPICAALLLMALGLRGRRGRWVRVGAAALGTVSALGFAAAVSKLEPSRVGSGMWCGLLGSACAVSASCLEQMLGNRRDAGVL